MIHRFVIVLFLAGSCLSQTPHPQILSKYVGIYALAPNANMTVTLSEAIFGDG